jgi:hypothetical protein
VEHGCTAPKSKTNQTPDHSDKTISGSFNMLPHDAEAPSIFWAEPIGGDCSARTMHEYAVWEALNTLPKLIIRFAGSGASGWEPESLAHIGWPGWFKWQSTLLAKHGSLETWLQTAATRGSFDTTVSKKRAPFLADQGRHSTTQLLE